jgi:group I intron endonuclease
MIDIYQLKNKVTGKSYIGQSSNINRRLSRHKYDLSHNNHHSPQLQEDYNKYGLESFECKILVPDIQEKIDADIIEESLINTYYGDTLYNVSKNATGGDNTSYHPDNELIRAKISEAGKQRYIDNPNLKEELRIRMTGENNPMYGKKHTEETKKKISEINRMHNKNKVFTDEERQRISERVNKQYKDHPEIHEKLTAALHRRYENDPSLRDKSTETFKKNWQDPEIRERIMKGIAKSAEKSRKAVHGDGVDYISIAEACKATNLTIGAIINRCRSSNFPDWYYL